MPKRRTREVAFDHYRHWNVSYRHRELGCTPHQARCNLEESEKSAMRAPPDFKIVKLWLSLRERRRVELGTRIEFQGRWWTIAKTPKKTVVIAVRAHEKEFYVLEDDLDPTSGTIPRILARYGY